MTVVDQLYCFVKLADTELLTPQWTGFVTLDH